MENDKFINMERKLREKIVEQYVDSAAPPDLAKQFMESAHIYWVIVGGSNEQFFAFRGTTDGVSQDYPIIWTAKHLARPFIGMAEHHLGQCQVLPIPSNILHGKCILNPTITTNNLTKQCDVEIKDIVDFTEQEKGQPDGENHC